ncbi:MAG: thiamine-binding protein [Thermoplasmata archaeon]|nr:MAG: thiamine-binding protein [Thermoplasmata archaeon]HEC88964.1 MTH1187 family thiamine-binding protein [Thermoplasmatales archaeon]
MVLAQLSISPLDVGISLHKYVKEVLKTLKQNDNIKFQVNDMSTIIEAPDIDTLFDVVKESHEAMFKAGARRVITELKIDDRRDKKVHLGDKRKEVEV